MEYYGEMLAFFVAFSWSASCVVFEYSSKHIGSATVNFYKLILSFVAIGIYMLFVTGSFLPLCGGMEAWLWILGSGLAGFMICDLAMFSAYVLIGARYTQLIMTVYPFFAALSAWLIIGESLPPLSAVGMVVAVSGVAITLFKRSKNSSTSLNIPLKGVILVLIAAVGQGLGFVLSKKGMLEYEAPEELGEQAKDLIPIAATQIRILAGLVGVALTLVLSRRLHLLKEAFGNHKALGMMSIGVIVGPLLGVICSLYALQYANAGVVSTIIATQPIILTLYDIIVCKKKVAPREVVGAFIAVIGVSLFFV